MKCINSKFKGSYQDDTLPVFESMRLKFKNLDNTRENYFSIQPLSSQPTSVKGTIKNGIWENSSTEVVFNYNSNNVYGTGRAFTSTSDEVIIHVKNKYNIVAFSLTSPANGKVTELSIEDFAYMQNFNINGVGCAVNIDKLKSFPLTNLNKVYLGFTSNISGKIDSLANALGLDTLFLHSGAVSGDINDLASAQVAKGRTSGSIAVTCGYVTTLNGVTVGNGTVKTITFDSSLPEGYSVS